MRRVLLTALYPALVLASTLAHAGDDEITIKLSTTSTAPLVTAPTATTALDLNELIDIALARNGQIAISSAEIAKAEALYELAAAQLFPAGSMTALFGGPTPEAKVIDETESVENITPASRQGDFDFGTLGVQFRLRAELAQPLYTFDKIDSLKRAAQHLVNASEHQRNITKADVVVNVTKAFWTVQLVQTFVRSLEEGSATLEKVLIRIEDMLESDTGQVTENDRLRLKFALATLDVRKTEAQAVYKVAQQAMRLLIGWSQDREIEIFRRELDELPEKTPKLEDLVVWSRSYRPELKALSEVVLAAEDFEENRKSNFWPTIFLGGLISYAYTSNATNVQNPFLYDRYNFFDVALGLGVRVDLDIMQKLAQLEQAEAEIRVREAQTQFVAQLVDLEVRKLYTEIEAGYKRIAKLERANRTARGWLTASTLAYDIGTGAADELIDAFLAWAASEAELQATRFNVLAKLVEMSRATGKLVGPHADPR